LRHLVAAAVLPILAEGHPLVEIRPAHVALLLHKRVCLPGSLGGEQVGLMQGLVDLTLAVVAAVGRAARGYHEEAEHERGDQQ
jgi:hypothetical protein